MYESNNMIGDDKIAKQNYSVARVVTHNRDDIGKFERHIERKNDNYTNMNVDLSQSHRNIRFKKCDCTYNDKLNEMVESKQVSLRGLKADAKVYDEMIFDVNTEYFESHGGYEFAKKFYEQAFHFAEKEMSSEYILSAVMHADEINLAASDKYGYPVYHYHLHIIALPVVQKEIKWSKRCKDKALVGTVKEVVNQVSHSKKWKSEQIVDENGNKILVPSYSLLQDKFFEYMQNAGFEDFVRGEKGSTRENLSVLQYQISKDEERLKDIQKKIEIVEPAQIEYKKIDEIGKKTFTGKVQMSNDDYDKLTSLAKEAITNRADIQYYKTLMYGMQRQIDDLQYKFDKLRKICRPYVEAIRIAPEKVKKFIDDILVKAREKAKAEKVKEEMPYPPIRRKPKYKSKEDFER